MPHTTRVGSLPARLLASLGLVAAAGTAQADVSVTAAWVSDYDWRGIMQTSGHDAVQLSGTWSGERGFYVGAWGSSLVQNAEIDLYAGFAGDIADSGVGYDLGLQYYTFTNTGGDANFIEGYAGLSYGMFAAKAWYSPEFGGDGGEAALYLEGDVKVPLSGGLSVLAHVGLSKGDGIEAYYGSDNSYIDWSVGLGYDVNNFSTFVKYVDGTDVSPGSNELSRVLFGISTTLPWGN